MKTFVWRWSAADDLERRIEVEIPEGWHRITRGQLLWNDRILDAQDLDRGLVTFTPVSEHKPNQMGQNVTPFILPIREGLPPSDWEKDMCQRCQATPRAIEDGIRVCRPCELVILRGIDQNSPPDERTQEDVDDDFD